jgi:carboxymethylenebutenolidase
MLNGATMKVESEFIDVPASAHQKGAGAIRCFVARPSGNARAPAVVAWSDIFQLTEPHLRICRRLAGHGFVVVAPELYDRLEPSGTVLDFEKDRQRALDDSDKMQLDWIDDDTRAVLEYAEHRADVHHDKIGVLGWCFGGHVAFRAALLPEIKAAACCYPTGVHSGKLGSSTTADTLSRVSSMKAELLLVWGRNDPHIPAEGRAKLHRALDDAGTRYEARLYDAEHTFMRDAEPKLGGARFDPEAADRAFSSIVDLFRRAL